MKKSIDSELLVRIIIRARSWYDIMMTISGEVTYSQIDAYTDGIAGMLSTLGYDEDESCKLAAGIMAAMIAKQTEDKGKSSDYDKWLKEG